MNCKNRLLCAHCGHPITTGSQSGLCRLCSQENRHRARFNQGRKCRDCGKPIVNWSKTGMCYACNHRQAQNYCNRTQYHSLKQERKREVNNRNGKSDPNAKIYKRQCWNKLCKKPFETTNPFERYHSDACRQYWLHSDAAWAYRIFGRSSEAGRGGRAW